MPDTLPGADAPIPDDEPLTLSFRQIDDYSTCPLKYKYIHRIRVPLLTHHRVVYGSAMHKAVQAHFQARLQGRAFGEDELVAAFQEAWVSEGFLSREHEEKRRAEGEQVLRRFHRMEAEHPWSPTAVEKEFAFWVDRTKIAGRYDLVIEREGDVTILDFKTGDVQDLATAQQRAKESLQLDIYALAHLKTVGRLPKRVELRFLESGLAGGKAPTLEETHATEERIREVSRLVRRVEFTAAPSYRACSQCPFRDICPHTAHTPEMEP